MEEGFEAISTSYAGASRMGMREQINRQACDALTSCSPSGDSAPPPSMEDGCDESLALRVAATRVEEERALSKKLQERDSQIAALMQQSVVKAQLLEMFRAEKDQAEKDYEEASKKEQEVSCKRLQDKNNDLRACIKQHESNAKLAHREIERVRGDLKILADKHKEKRKDLHARIDVLQAELDESRGQKETIQAEHESKRARPQTANDKLLIDNERLRQRMAQQEDPREERLPLQSRPPRRSKLEKARQYRLEIEQEVQNHIPCRQARARQLAESGEIAASEPGNPSAAEIGKSPPPFLSTAPVDAVQFDVVTSPASVKSESSVSPVPSVRPAQSDDGEPSPWDLCLKTGNPRQNIE
ncbi:hypothetical protein BU16DRAFT_187587 [Lophium mytilinum]|uniref:Uncharacterized protein n=1 Tax=Lophium mytilinum TaxID=390894 RepID=A0A6A6R876_9PEZI|nr:hypothetical protein BU16DRAFT_187587 [Lophium mytilinum]